MRQIKFRAWVVNERNSFLGRNDLFEANNRMIYNFIIWDGKKVKFYELKSADKCILMQYTGLKDKNGKEIYEGDIVAMEIENWEVDYPEKTKAIGVVMWDKDCGNFYVQWLYSANNDDTKRFIELCPWQREKLEVVGNVFENTDLIEDCVKKEWREEQKRWKENFFKSIELLKGDDQ